MPVSPGVSPCGWHKAIDKDLQEKGRGTGRCPFGRWHRHRAVPLRFYHSHPKGSETSIGSSRRAYMEKRYGRRLSTKPLPARPPAAGDPEEVNVFVLGAPPMGAEVCCLVDLP